MNAEEYLKAYYAVYDEDGRLQLQHGRVEYLITMRYIDRYLEPGMRVLDIGAGTGRYTLALAEAGFEVDAIDLCESNIDILRKGISRNMRVHATQGNALDLSRYEDGTFDITLLMGPMYHLFNAEDQAKALQEALRVTKPGGLLFVAYCIADASILSFGFIQGHIWDLVEKNMLDPVTFVARSEPKDLFQLYRREDIDALNQGLAAERLHYVATDLATGLMRATVDAMDDETFHLYMQYQYMLCERTDMSGMTNHSLDILRKDL